MGFAANDTAHRWRRRWWSYGLSLPADDREAWMPACAGMTRQLGHGAPDFAWNNGEWCRPR